jgi:hypothetical protein
MIKTSITIISDCFIIAIIISIIVRLLPSWYYN